jgi:hypothetical protein
MAVKWSWVFGPETNTELDEMGWTLSDLNTSNITQSSTNVYTYPGSPPRNSINLKRTRTVFPPNGAYGAEGWACVAFYCSDFFDEWGENYHAIKINSAVGGKSIKIFSDASSPNQTMILQVDDTFDPSGSIAVTQDDWHYIALQYSMTGTTWAARWYLDGVPVGSLTTDVSAHATTDEQITLSIAGMSNTDSLFTWYGQMTSYDDWSDDGSKPLYVTRVSPDTDLGGFTSGSWNPVGAASNAQAVESPFGTSSYSNNSSISSGERLGVSAGGASLASKLNIDVSSTIYGITNHAFVTGSGMSGAVGIGNASSPGIYHTGSSIYPDTSDITYGYSTSGSFTASDSPVMIYEVE